MAKLLAFLFLSLLNLNCIANEVAKSTGSTKVTSNISNQAPVLLGDCKQQIDPKTKTEEFFVRTEAKKAGLSKEELLARLIYSESLSTRYFNDKCTAKSEDDILTIIAWGIMNRVKKKAKTSLDAYAYAYAYAYVIFMKNQFKTSFSSKKINPFAQAFLCPSKSNEYLDRTTKKQSATNLYKKSQDIANSIIRDYEKSGIKEKYKNITNFFYPYSEYFREFRPNWAAKKRRIY